MSRKQKSKRVKSRQQKRKTFKKSKRFFSGGGFHPLAAANIPESAVVEYREADREMYSVPYLVTKAEMDQKVEEDYNRA